MKRNFFLIIGMILFTFCSCNKLKSPFENVVYLTGAKTDPFVKITADSTGGSFVIKASSSGLVKEQVIVKVETDTALVAEYNKREGRNYKPLPEGSYRLTSNTLSFSPGSSLSDELKLEVLSIKDFELGSVYMMPVTIKSASSLPVLEKSRTIFIEVNRVQFFSAASLSYNTLKVDFSANDKAKAMTAGTWEVWVQPYKFQLSNPYISDIMGNEASFQLRFGDVLIEPDQAQVIFGDVVHNITLTFTANVWYHIATSFDGNTMKIYVNGEEVVSKQVGALKIDLSSNMGFTIGGSNRSYWGRQLAGAISEARIWTRGLSQAEIVSGMCGIDPANPDLLAYWKFNDGAGNIAYDISGNEHHATAAKNVTWIKDIKCN